MSALVTVEKLRKEFAIGREKLVAVDDVSFTITRGETVGLVGESGCGKSTLARLLVALLQPTSGRVLFDGTPLDHRSPPELRRLRRRFQMVFQDPHASLNPRMRVGRILEEPLQAQGVPRLERRRRVREVIEQVGMPVDALERFPHMFSGGQRQRIGIARALSVKPDLVVFDEPVAALDVSIQSQILNLMCDLKREHGLTYLFIAHDLSVVEYISDRIGVMYLGQLVEWGSRDQVCGRPRHPYTQRLLAASPQPEPGRQARQAEVQGEPPDPMHPPGGCPFHTRCPHAMDICHRTRPALETDAAGHWTACHLHQACCKCLL